MILAINTSTPQFALALLREDGSIHGEYCVSQGIGHFGSLMPALNFLLTATAINIHDMKAIVVAMGPGSFTGLRVGISLAKGLCHALDVPIIGISSLEALAYQLPFSRFSISPLIDSRKGEVFTARFTWRDDQTLIRNNDDTCINLANLSSLFTDTTIFIGNDYKNQGGILKKTLGPKAILAPAHCWNLKASTVGSLGHKRFHTLDYDDLQTLNPIYFRPPDIRQGPSLREKNIDRWQPWSIIRNFRPSCW